MKNKILKILGIVLLVLLFCAVVVTSVLISNKKKAIKDIPEATSVVSLVKTD